MKEVRWPRQKSPQVERREARVSETARGTSQRCQTKTLRLTGAPLPLWREKEMKAAPRASPTPGADGACPHVCARFRRTHAQGNSRGNVMTEINGKKLTGRIAADRIRMTSTPKPPSGAVERFLALGECTS